MQAQDKKDLEEVRNDFVSDGLRWGQLDSDKKLVHLWRKLKRTEQMVKSQSREVSTLRPLVFMMLLILTMFLFIHT